MGNKSQVQEIVIKVLFACYQPYHFQVNTDRVHQLTSAMLCFIILQIKCDNCTFMSVSDYIKLIGKRRNFSLFLFVLGHIKWIRDPCGIKHKIMFSLSENCLLQKKPQFPKHTKLPNT